ncbi:MAG: RnfH family protein [Lysobacterales bacterium]|jgi:putative ubiquitin-RnfH superfamily antitoxin RatB of RatAB toxin-antitoxin module
MTAADAKTRISIEVVLALAASQEIRRLELPAGSTVADAIAVAGFPESAPGYEFDPDKVGIFGARKPLDTVLRDGDRVELYRPLLADPKEARRQRARRQRRPKT